MGGILVAGAGCCCACCCGECGEGCRKCLGPERVTKLYYFILVIVFVIPAIFVFYFLNQWIDFLQYFESWFSCPVQFEDKYSCIGSSAIFRLSLCLLILFGILMIIMAFRSRCSMAINEGCFLIKYFLVVGIFIGFLWVKNTVFQGYATASQYISILFMIIQAIILIDLFYLASIKFIKKYDSGSSQYACLLITLTIIAEAIAIAFNVLGYIYFSGCSLWLNIITSILLIIMPVIQLFRFNDQNSLLTTALVSVYISFLNFIAQFSFSGSQICTPISTGSLVTDVVISTFFFILTMYGSIMGGTGQVKVTRNGNINAAMGVAYDEVEGQQTGKQQAYQAAPAKSIENFQTLEVKNQEKYLRTWDWVKWHLYMCLAVIYVGMLITNWNSASIVTGQLQSSGFGFWVRVIISWATFLLYVWTMIAPRVCPSRDFRVE